MIVGTAGHIDHGKTSLVRALTGVDTDRLPEERRRGITIELGFAPLELPGVGRTAVVDVPGHEAFVRTMLAGASGIDLALVVVAADEGVMPQTREHLAILGLLGVHGGVVALTKADLVEPDWLALVAEEVREVLAGGSLAGAGIVPASSVTGDGLDTLRARLADAARALPARDDFAHFRMPVDRVFSIRGTGTVVTGTVWSGTAARDGSVTAYPGGARLRVRGVQQHGAAVDAAAAGARAALALAAVDVDAVPRGAVLVDGDGWQETRVLRATVSLLPDAPPLKPRTRVRLHLGTLDVGARVVTSGGALQPGERKGARLVLDAPIVARGGDRFVLRAASPVVTVGGGVISDPHPPHRRSRPWSVDRVGPRDLFAEMLHEAGSLGVPRAALPVRLGVRPDTVERVLTSLGDGAIVVGDRVFAAGAVERIVAALVAAVDAHHAAAPLEPGLSRQHARSQLAAAAALADHAVSLALARGLVAASGGALRRVDWTPSPTEAQARRRDAMAGALEAAGREPPTLGELADRLPGEPSELAALARLLERAGVIVGVEADRYYAASALGAMVEQLRASMVAGRTYGPAELRDVLGVSRKFLIPLLEHFDRVGVTRRVAEGRALGGT